jgi:hypothetical protein
MRFVKRLHKLYIKLFKFILGNKQPVYVTGASFKAWKAKVKGSQLRLYKAKKGRRKEESFLNILGPPT